MVDAFDELKGHPSFFGWVVEVDWISSPDGSWGIDRRIIASRGIEGAYASLAARYESGARLGSARLEDLATLLDAVRSFPAVAALVERHARVRVIVEQVASVRNLAVTLWDFSNPAVRATARHPSGGIVALECELQSGETTEVAAMGWQDHQAGFVLARRSWRESRQVRDGDVNEALLLKTVERLAHPPEQATWRESRLFPSAAGPDLYTEALPLLDTRG